MRIKSILCAVSVCLAVFSINANASLISTDWKSSGDGLITRDTVTGLEWLDLTVTNGMSYNYVNGELADEKQFSGFRYATNSEVIALWSKLSINLNPGSASIAVGVLDPKVEFAAGRLGNTFSTLSSYPYGTKGMTSEWSQGYQTVLGAYQVAFPYPNTPYTSYCIYRVCLSDPLEGYVGTGSYLVALPVSAVPIPSAVWLFGSGLLGLVGVVRRKKYKT